MQKKDDGSHQETPKACGEPTEQTAEGLGEWN